MHRSLKTVGVALLLVVFFMGTAQATEIFFWQHDNNVRVTDRVFNTSLTVTQSLTRTLDNLDYDYTLSRNMPEDLSEYDLVMTALSFLCPG